MKQFRLLKYENNFWILQYYDEDEELIQEQFINLDTARSFIDGLGFQLHFEPNLN